MYIYVCNIDVYISCFGEYILYLGTCNLRVRLRVYLLSSSGALGSKVKQRLEGVSCPASYLFSRYLVVLCIIEEYHVYYVCICIYIYTEFCCFQHFGVDFRSSSCSCGGPWVKSSWAPPLQSPQDEGIKQQKIELHF